MKKSLFILPLIALLAACGTSGGGKKGDGEKGQDIPKEVDILESRESFVQAAGSIKTVMNAIGSKKVAHLKGEVSGGNLELVAHAVQAVEEEGAQADRFDVDLKVKNVAGKLDAAVTGFKLDGTEFSTADLKAYVKLSGMGANLDLSYRLPDVLYAKDEEEVYYNSFANYVEQSGRIAFNESGIGAAAYLTENDVYVDVSDAKIYKVLDAILNSGVIKLFPAQEEPWSSMALIGGFIEGFTGKVGVQDIVPVETGIKGELPEFNPEELITEEDFASVKETVAPYLEMFGVKTYAYGASSKYSYGIEVNLDKKVVENLAAMFLAEQLEGHSLDELLAVYGVELKKIDNKLSFKLGRDGSVELACSVDNEVTMDVPAEVAQGVMSMQSFTASLKVSGQSSVSLSFDDSFDALPDFAGYQDLTDLVGALIGQ